MTTLEGNGKVINFKCSDNVTVLGDNEYELNLPMVSCTKMEDAKYMQTKINEFVKNLSRELVK